MALMIIITTMMMLVMMMINIIFTLRNTICVWVWVCVMPVSIMEENVTLYKCTS